MFETIIDSFLIFCGIVLLVGVVMACIALAMRFVPKIFNAIAGFIKWQCFRFKKDDFDD